MLRILDLKNIFRALRNRNYRLFFTGQSLSLVGTWMQQIALSWLVYRMTHSAFLLGVVGFAAQAPTFFLSPLAGIIADRYPKRRALVATQALSMFQAFVLTFLIVSGQITVGHIIALSVFLGIVNGFDMPIRQAFTIEMVDTKDDLGNAIALNSSIVNLARLIGPSVAGILIATVGEGVCFLINALSYIPVIVCLGAMRIFAKEVKEKSLDVVKEFKEGVFYAVRSVPIRHILFLLVIVNFLGTPYQIFMPIFAREIFLGGPQTLSLLVAMAGAGALAGAVYLASRKSVVGLGRVIALSSGLFGLGLVLFSFSRILWFSLAVVFLSGFFMMVLMAASNTILQTICEENMRGRIMSFYAMAFMGTVPFGNLLAGSVASTIGAPLTLCLGGICCVLGSLGFASQLAAVRKAIRPIYIQKGIIPQVVQGIQSASG